MSNYQSICQSINLLISSAIAYLGDKNSMEKANCYCEALLLFTINYSDSETEYYQHIAFAIGAYGIDLWRDYETG